MADENYREAGDDGGAMSDSLVNSQEEAPQKRPGGIKAPFKWFMEKPLSRWPFALFCLFGILCFLWLILFITGGDTGYVMAGIAAIVMSLYGANHFRILLGLKEEVDKMAKLNREFRAENAALKMEVDKLSKAREQLTGVEQGLRESNRKLKENVEKFKQLDQNLKKLADSNIEGLEKLQQSSAQVMKTMHESLVRHEKEILNKVFDHLEWGDQKEGLTEDEFDEFLKSLPSSYRERFAKMGKTFRELAGDDGSMDYQEFTDMVDQFAEMEAADGGSQ